MLFFICVNKLSRRITKTKIQIERNKIFFLHKVEPFLINKSFPNEHREASVRVKVLAG